MDYINPSNSTTWFINNVTNNV